LVIRSHSSRASLAAAAAAVAAAAAMDVGDPLAVGFGGGGGTCSGHSLEPDKLPATSSTAS